MKFVEFARQFGVPVNAAEASFVSLLLDVCEEHRIDRRRECVQRFLALSNDMKAMHSGRGDLAMGQRFILEELRDMASLFCARLDDLGGQERLMLEDQNLSAIDLDESSVRVWKDAAARVCGHKGDRDVLGRAARRFVLLCHQFRIPVTWSKSIESCSKTSATFLLGALYQAACLDSDVEGAKPLANKANYQLGKLSKGFRWEFDFEGQSSEQATVYFNRIEFDAEAGLKALPRFG